MAKNQGPWGNNDNANPWGDNEETLNSPKVEEDMRCEQRNFGSRSNTPKASRVSKERSVAITNSIAKKVSRPATSKVA